MTHTHLFNQLAREIMATDPHIVYTPFKSQTTIQGMFKSPKKHYIIYIYFIPKSKTDLYTVELVDGTTRELISKFSQSGRHQIVRRLMKIWK